MVRQISRKATAELLERIDRLPVPRAERDHARAQFEHVESRLDRALRLLATLRETVKATVRALSARRRSLR